MHCTIPLTHTVSMNGSPWAVYSPLGPLVEILWLEDFGGGRWATEEVQAAEDKDQGLGGLGFKACTMTTAASELMTCLALV